MKKIYIYNDKGVGEFSFNETLTCLKECSICEGFEILPIDAKALLSSNWQEGCALLVMPGGRDIPYHRALKGKGTQLISNYVKSGGSYLGICAGAYFGSKEVVFEEGKKHEVIDSRELSFFPGRAIGTIYAKKPFSYREHSSSHAALIQSEDHSLYTYYNGGCYFENADKSGEQITVLSRYQNALLHDVPAIIFCKIGEGRALLSGVHFEVSSSSKEDQSVFKTLQKDESKRREFASHLLSKLLL